MNKMSKEYMVKIPESKRPRLRIFDIEDEMEDEELTTAIENQNPEIINEQSEINVKINKKAKNTCIVVIEVDALIFGRVMKDRRLKIGWQRFQVKEYVGIS